MMYWLCVTCKKKAYSRYAPCDCDDPIVRGESPVSKEIKEAIQRRREKAKQKQKNKQKNK